MVFACQAGRITSRLTGRLYEKSFVKKIIVVRENLFRTSFSPGDNRVRFSTSAPIQKLLPLPDGFNRIHGTENSKRLGGD